MPHNDLAWAIEDVKGRAPAIQKYRRMYEGDHPTILENQATLSPLMRDLLEELSDNLCDDVVDEPTDRLAVKAWTGVTDAAETPDADGARPADTLGDAANDVWETNRGPARFRQIVRDAWMAGDGYAIVESDDNGRARFYPQAPEQMAVRYHGAIPDLIQVAAKLWLDGKRWRANLYYGPEDPGGPRLERYATKGTSPGGGVPDPKAFLPLPGVSETGEALAVEGKGWAMLPVFHFPADEVGRYGRSCIKDVVPLQNLLNKSITDMVTAMEEVALPGRWATGVTSALDENGNERPLYRRTKSALEIMRTSATDASFGQFPGADLSQFLSVQESYRLEIARKGYLPRGSVGLGDGATSGLHLLVEEGRQIKRVKGAQRDMGWTLRQMMAYALTVDLGRPVAVGDLNIEWERAETRDDQALWELLMLKKDLGVPDRQILLEGGYTPDQVDEWLDGKAEQDDAMEGGRMSVPGAGIGLLAMAPGAPAGAPDPAQV